MSVHSWGESPIGKWHLEICEYLVVSYGKSLNSI